MAKNGHKLQKLPADGESKIKKGSTGELSMVVENTSMAQWTIPLSNFVQRPVIDKTGREGAYNFTWILDPS